jgi:hypothetical protein
MHLLELDPHRNHIVWLIRSRYSRQIVVPVLSKFLSQVRSSAESGEPIGQEGAEVTFAQVSGSRLR